MEKIDSLQNPKIKHIVKLRKASERKKSGQFIIEGLREIELAIKTGFEVDYVLYNPDILEKSKNSRILKELVENHTVYHVSQDAFARIAYREGTEGIVVVARQRHSKLEKLIRGHNPLVIVIEAVEKPGNLGAILRTADAAGVTAAIICDPLTDLFNPNLIRSSLGSVFTVPLAITTSTDAYSFLSTQNINVFATTLQATTSYLDQDYSGPTAFVMGSEAAGLSTFWRKNAKAEIKIPMQGVIDSLNVAGAAAICVYEALRQRGLKI